MIGSRRSIAAGAGEPSYKDHSRLPVELQHDGLPAARRRLLGAGGPAKLGVVLRRLEAGSRSGSRGAAELADRAPAR